MSLFMPVWKDGKKTGEMEEMFKGLCLADREWNMRDDSDFYVRYWDWETMRPREYTYDTTRFASSGGYVVIDATEEVKKAYREFLIHNDFVDLCNAYWNNARKIEKGSKMMVVGGRKNKEHIGRVGVVFWEGSYCFGYYNKGMKYGIRFSDEKNEKGHYVDSIFEYDKNLEHVEFEIGLPTDEEIWKIMEENSHESRRGITSFERFIELRGEKTPMKSWIESIEVMHERKAARRAEKAQKRVRAKAAEKGL